MRQASFDGAPRGAALDWSRVRRVLLVRLRSIGDTVLMTPCLAALKTWRTDIRLTVLSEPLSAPLLEDHPHVDELIVAPTGFGARARVLSRLRRERFDVAFNMHGGTTATFLAGLSSARRSVGYEGYRYSWLLDARAPAPDVILGRRTIHSVEQQLALLYWAGVPWPASDPCLTLAVSDGARALARARLGEAGLGDARFALIAPSAAFESKRWKAAGFAAVIDHLRERYNLPSLVVAGPAQEYVAREADGRSGTELKRVDGYDRPGSRIRGQRQRSGAHRGGALAPDGRRVRLVRRERVAPVDRIGLPRDRKPRSSNRAAFGGAGDRSRR